MADGASREDRGRPRCRWMCMAVSLCRQERPAQAARARSAAGFGALYPSAARTCSGRGIGATAPYPVHFKAAATLA